MPYFRFALLCLIWGSSFLLMKRAGAGLSPWAIGAGRVLTGMCTLLVISQWARLNGPSSAKPPANSVAQTFLSGRVARSQWPALLGVMLMGYAIPYSTQPLFISRTGSSSLAAMGVGFTPLFTLVFSIPILGIRPTLKQTLGVLGALVCLLLLLVDSAERSLAPVDMLLLFSTPLLYALANIWMRMSLADVPPIVLTTICLGISGLLLLPLACTMPAPPGFSTAVLPLSVGCLIVLGIFGTGLGMLLFNQLVQEQGPLFAAMVTNLTPIGAVLLGWADAERVTSLQSIALAGVVACVAVVQWGALTAPPK